MESTVQQRPITSMFASPRSSPLTAVSKSQIDTAIESYIIDALKPLGTVEQPSFIQLIVVLEPRYQMPARKTIVSHFNKSYNCLVADLKSELSDSPNIAFTHDSWSSLNTQSYGTVTAHFVSKQWALSSKVLETKLFPGSHTAEAISKSLKDTLVQEWGLKIENLIGVTDNAANEKRAFDILNCSRLSYMGHNINLSVKAGLGVSEIDRLVGKGRSLVSYFHKSPLAMDVLLKKHMLLPREAQGHKLIQDVATRWNSTLDMLERLSEQTVAIHATISDPSLVKVKNDLASKLFAYDDQRVVGQMIQLLKPFKNATETLSSEKIPTTPFILPTLIKLNMFLEPKPDDITCVKKMKAEMSKNLAKRLPSEEREICMLSSLLHPKTKQLGFLDAAEKETAKFLLSSTAKNSHSDSGTSGIKTEPEVLTTSTNQVPTPSVDNFTIKREVEVEELEREIFVEPKAKKICTTTDHSQAWLDDIICVANDSVETGT